MSASSCAISCASIYHRQTYPGNLNVACALLSLQLVLVLPLLSNLDASIFQAVLEVFDKTLILRPASSDLVLKSRSVPTRSQPFGAQTPSASCLARYSASAGPVAYHAMSAENWSIRSKSQVTPSGLVLLTDMRLSLGLSESPITPRLSGTTSRSTSSSSRSSWCPS